MSVSSKPAFDFALYESLEKAALIERVQRVRQAMGPRLLILGHHYQQDDVIALSDLRGDSFGLSEKAAAAENCEAIVFCGVHFMAETADILANRPERLAARGFRRVPVVLPDPEAGCSLAEMADIAQVERCWEELAALLDVSDLMPITYVNSSAALKAFCGRQGGIVCTSSNAGPALQWAFQRRSRVLFFPDQHLGRNTAKAQGIPLEQMVLWNPRQHPYGGNPPEMIRRSRVILWNGFCCVHQVFLPEHILRLRKAIPGIKIVVHPECMMEVADLADEVGSTSKIIRVVEDSSPGTRWAIGTEPHLVKRLRAQHPDKDIRLLSPTARICDTMFRISLPRLCWAVENLAAGAPVGVVEVVPEIVDGALLALGRMLEVR